jgi:signal transduction histidine kinase
VRGEGLVVDYRSSGDLADVPARVGVALYRIAQEALHNAIRHAPSADTRVAVAVTAIGVDLEVDSVGVQPQPADANQTHFGIIGMRERAAMIGAELEAGATEQGWRVRCRVPVSVP